MTNAEMFKKVFGFELNTKTDYYCPFNSTKCDNLPCDACIETFWQSEYKEPSDTKTITISKGAVKHGNKDYVVYKRDWLMEHLNSEFEVLKEVKNLMKKIQNAKPSTWLTDGLTEEEVKQAIKDGKERAIHCKNCKYLEEVNGEHCYECVKGIENNYEPNRDCKNCKHRIPTVDIVKCKFVYGCELWECQFEPKDTDECPMQAFYEMKQDTCKEHNGNCKECNMVCDIKEEDIN